MEILVRVPGSCGELLQGVVDNTPFLVTCPIDRYTEVYVSDSISGTAGLGQKSQQAMKAMIERLGEKNFPWGIRLNSELPQGKGMASSSADIAAVSAAVALAYGYQPDADMIMDIATGIEPTDGVFLDGIVCMNQLTGEIRAQYFDVPSMRITIFDAGGTIDTLEFHKSRRLLGNDNSPKYKNLLAELAEVWQEERNSNEARLAAVATKSAKLNQDYLNKPHYEELYSCAKELGAVGIAVAHSGTVIGALWSSGMKDAEHLRVNAELTNIFSGLLTPMGKARLIGGGIHIIQS